MKAKPLHENSREARDRKLLAIEEKIRKQKEDASEKKVRRRLLQYYLQKCGYETEPDTVKKAVRNIAFVTAFILATLYNFYLVSIGMPILESFLIFGLVFFAVFILVYLLSLLAVFVFLDLRMFRRKKEIESVLADFIQLTSANMHAGMTLDKALWFAVRPKFGILAKEIETVAKETSSGTSIDESLKRFAEKYDSNVLQSSVSLIIEGLNAGGEMGALLSRISANIKENQLMIREMAANVSTYIIFISSAALIAAPLLMALSYQLLLVVTKLSSTLEMPSGEIAGSMPIAFSHIVITPVQFRIFSILSLAVTALFSAIIISIIRTGDARNSVKSIFVYVITAVVIFLLLSSALRGLFTSFI